ncbi:FAD dependent oxidoreductase superfamily protein [Purpureocillium lilacinum]|uniref:FAD dependent oxidoreductase superfamily protein n=1 Tax=Purpureocillium lilacinum TaxID=33203 RepID=A0A179GHI3_PURLI|nr:FAD dependent oxidoreductase superfamily protein [Purpureocillium lilacinum]
MPQIVVVGAGVIGLSCGLRLLRAGYRVAIVARDFPVPFETASAINYTSLWAGAHNRWNLPTTPAEEPDHAMARQTYAHMERLVRTNPECGVTFTPGIEYFEDPPEAYRALDARRAGELGFEGFRKHAPEELPEGVALGFEYRTWCVNPMVYCMFLLRQFCLGGGTTATMELRHPHEVFAAAPFRSAAAVVNCSGVGFGDPAVFPTRGQTCVVSNGVSATVTRQNKDGSWTFAVPRGFDGGTVIGGTKEPDDWDPEPSPEVRAQLLDRFAATYPAVLADGPYRVVRDIVGRRPTRRGGMRLEAEELGRRRVVHAYGLGGRGYELSWGVAEAVLALLK